MNTVVSASAICSTVMCEQNSGGVIASRYSLSAAISTRTSSCSGLSTETVSAMAPNLRSLRSGFAGHPRPHASGILERVSRVGCDVRREVAGEIELPGGALWDDELVLGFHVPPLLEPRPLLGHLMVVPRRHADTWADLTDDEASRIGLAAARLARPLRAATSAERIYTAVLGHHSPHFHLHLFPRYPGTPEEYRFLDVDEWPGAPRGGAPEIAAFVVSLRDAI